MICFPNAKINLGLHVVEKREDGYHNMETVFYPIPLKDALEIVPAPDFSFTQVGESLDSLPEDNLVIKALNLFKKNYDIPPLAIFLKKAIPFGAGLGGGSADAAFMLKMLNTYTSLNLNDEELEKMAVEIGADCPFFIRNRPVVASGIGNIFECTDLSLKGYTLCIIKPNLFVSTKDAYSFVKPCKPSIPLKKIIQMPVKEWKQALKNNFETGVFQTYPIISEIKDFFYAHESVYAAMSGSGSAVFGLFEKDVDLSFPDCFIWKGILQ
jgi:4-diphosphocytidyl-2-C-methyl-D-erythritol kinase